MTESLRRSLADPFHLGDEIPKWEPPAAIPRPETLRPAIAELERTLTPAESPHQQWCVGKLFVLPTRDGTPVKAAMQADNFIDACGHFPTDLWTAGTIELLQSSTFRPSPAELFAAVNPRYQLRQRMLERAKSMLHGPALVAPEAEKLIETRLGRMEHTRSIYVRMKRMTDVQRIDREIAAETGQPVVTSAAEIPASTAAATERPAFVPDPRLAALAERHAPSPMRAVIVPKKPANTATHAPAPPPVSEDWSRYEVE